MKKILITSFLLISNFGISQTKVSSVNVNTTDTTKMNLNSEYPIVISIKKGESQKIHDKEYCLSQIERIDQHIKSIDDKIKWVKENEIVDSLWILNMEKIKSELIDEKIKLTQTIK